LENPIFRSIVSTVCLLFVGFWGIVAKNVSGERTKGKIRFLRYPKTHPAVDRDPRMQADIFDKKEK